MSVENTRKVITGYFEADHDVDNMLAKDVVFTIMATGEEYKGRDAVKAMLDHFYDGAFTANARSTNLVIGESGAVLEARVVGTHTGEFAGVPATGKEIDVPLCVVYDIEGDVIKRGRVYFENPVFLQQVGAAG